MAAAKVDFAVVTVSDTRSADDDDSGAEIKRLLGQAGHRLRGYEIVPDDPGRVAAAIARLAGEVDAVIVNGGTGIAPRDNTYEAITGLIDKRIDGFGELFRMLSYQQIGTAAMASRAVAGLVGQAVVFSLPGSTAACRLACEKLIVPELGHLCSLSGGSAKVDGGDGDEG